MAAGGRGAGDAGDPAGGNRVASRAGAVESAAAQPDPVPWDGTDEGLALPALCWTVHSHCTVTVLYSVLCWALLRHLTLQGRSYSNYFSKIIYFISHTPGHSFTRGMIGL